MLLYFLNMISQNSTLKNLPILAIRATHYAVLLFIVLGWIFVKKEILVIHMVMIPLVILQWKINNGRCLLTDLEHYLVPAVPEESEEQSEGFVARILKTVLKIELSPSQLMSFMYSVMALSFSVSFVKVFIL